MKDLDKLIEQYKKELEYIPESNIRDKVLGKSIIEIINLVKESCSENCVLNYVISKLQGVYDRELLSPLTLNEGEFIYKEPGLSINRRADYIKMDIKGIYDERCFKISIAPSCVYSIGYPEDEYELTPYNNDNRLYIMFGSQVSSIYFDKFYLTENFIKEHSYIPSSPIIINPIVIINYNINKYICCVNNKFSFSRRKYKPNYTKDEDKGLEEFNINFNFDIDACC